MTLTIASAEYSKSGYAVIYKYDIFLISCTVPFLPPLVSFADGCSLPRLLLECVDDALLLLFVKVDVLLSKIKIFINMQQSPDAMAKSGDAP